MGAVQRHHRQLADVSSWSRALREGRVVEDVCVTSWTIGSDSAGRSVRLPCSGFRVGLALAPFGGEEAVRAACSGCEANVAPGEPPALAGCHGYFDAWPDSEQLEAELREKMQLRGLEAAVTRLFPRTTPLWYGLWIESPLRRPQCEVLLALLEGSDDPDEARDDDLRHFLAALRTAVSWELALHVEMHSPGHTDFGWYTVFPHCPRCQAEAPVPRWQESYPDDPLDCPVCGQRYSPAATCKAEPMDNAVWDAQRLENVLGAEEAKRFRWSFLVHQGCSPEQIEDVFDRQSNGPLKRRINDLRRRQEEVRRSLPARGPVPEPLPAELALGLRHDLTLRLRLVPAGEFLMGTAGPPEEAGNEGPQHRVRIARPSYLADFPVTQAQFEAVMDSNPSRFTGDSDRPVEQVSWFAAQEFCLRLSRAAGRWVRLPSEVEWEYACRAGTTSKYHWGEEVTAEQVNCRTGDPMALFLGEDEGGQQPVSTSVCGRYPANAWGICDLHGNVQEWCEDEWHDNYEGAPADGSAWVTPGDENPLRPVRGGSCWHHAAVCTSASRQQRRADADDEPDELPTDNLLAALLRDRPPIGFRVVVEAG